MARRTKFPRPRAAVSLADETKVGSHLLVFNEDEVIQLLRAAVEREGNQIAFARRHGLERSGLNMILNGKRPVTSAVVKALGLRKVYAQE
jgi:DNA-binding phage protein